MNIFRDKLENGAKILTIPLDDTPTVTVLVMVEAGSKYETKENNGVSHFLEHMCFQGTKKRSNPGEISYELESLGAEHNTFTSQEYTGYYAKGQVKHLDKFIELVSDLYINPTFPEDAIEREKGVIIEELNMYEDLPTRRAYEYLMNLMYEGQPAGWDIIGTKENIKKFKKKDFVDYQNLHYVPESTTIVVAGSVNRNKIVQQVSKYFSPIPSKKKTGKVSVIESQEKPEILIKNKKTDQSHISIGIRAFDINHKDVQTLQVISTILGRGMSSRLFGRMRNELGMCYYTNSFTDLYTDHGYLGVRSGVNPKRTHEAIEVIIEELRKIQSETVTEKELEKAKNFLVGQMYLSLEPTDDIAVYYAQRETLDQEIKPLKKIEENTRKVSPSDVKRVCNNILKNDGLNLAIVGPIEDSEKKDLEEIFKI